MGWAPLILFSGLCLTIIRPWQFFLWFFGDYIQQLLLDKAPFNFVSLTIGNTLTTTDFSKLWFLKGDSFRFDWRTRDTRTPTRSQVRAVCHLRLYLLVWIPFLLPQIFSISTQWSEGCAVNMDSVRVAAPPWFPAAKEHVEELQLASGHTQTNYKQCIRKRSYKRAIRRAE